MADDGELKRELLWSRWDEIDRLLDEALDLPPEARAGFVEHAARGDPALRELLARLVERMATDHARVASPSASVVEAVFGSEADADPLVDLAPGTEVGRYVILTRRARGGMATVYEAERGDGVYRQRVALKVLRRGLDTEDLVRRFLTERQILSSLTHPNIARLLDGGSTPDGRPYLVMDLVDGRPITAYADDRRLDVGARLELFLSVADAVRAAHRQLVVHRDIKPANVMVDAEGRVKLLDFGIAKLLTEDAGRTEVGARALTPEYASPEQLRGDPITTATDVYQLGLLLRTLLTGLRPLAEGADRAEPPVNLAKLALRDVRGAPPAADRAAARGTTPPRLARRLAADLGLIVGKALRPEPELRYASADEMAADVRRHLRGEPVLAHPESAAYRVRKFVRRHLVGVGVATGAVLLVIGYALTTNLQSARVAAERDRAEQEARKAAQVTDFLVNLFHSADPNLAVERELTARELLDAGARQIEGDLVGDRAVRAAMRSAIGESYYRLGHYRDAGAMLERAIEDRRAVGGSEREAIASDLNLLALATRGGDLPRSLELFDEALRTAEAAVGPDHPLTARILTDYGEAFPVNDEAGMRRSRDMRERAVAILRAAPGDVREDLAHALAIAAYGQSADEALPRMREALALRREVYGERHTAVAVSLSDLALATEEVDRMAADSLLSEALEILIAIHGERHALPLTIMNNLAAVRRDRGAWAEAEPLYRKVLALRRELYPENRTFLAYSLFGLGVVLVETGEAVEGEARLREAESILALEAPGSVFVALTRSAIGHALARQGRFPEAEGLMIPATREIMESSVSPLDKATVLERVSGLYRSWGRPADALVYEARLDSLVAGGGMPAEPGRPAR